MLALKGGTPLLWCLQSSPSKRDLERATKAEVRALNTLIRPSSQAVIFDGEPSRRDEPFVTLILHERESTSSYFSLAPRRTQLFRGFLSTFFPPKEQRVGPRVDRQTPRGGGGGGFVCSYTLRRSISAAKGNRKLAGARACRAETLSVVEL